MILQGSDTNGSAGKNEFGPKHFRKLMKASILLVAASITMLSIGCKKAPDAAKLQSAALSSLTATYSNLNSADLAFAGMTNLPSTDGVAAIEIRYILPASAETNQEAINHGQRTIIKTRAFRVLMSPSGLVQSVSEGKIATVRTELQHR